jgi:hypothetical protein
MRCNPRRIVLWVLGPIIFGPSLAFAWGGTGHRVVCQIAYEELLTEAREEIDRLLALDPNFESFAESCLFADSPERIRWRDHFINLPRSALAITTFDCPMADTCILPAIRNDFLILLDPESSDTEKLLALKLLGHWVGDVHQPMHVSFQDDRGANSNVIETEIEVDFEGLNLHGIWDYMIISQIFGDDYQAIANDLQEAISDQQRLDWMYDSPIEWANESYQITISPGSGYCVQQSGACWYNSDNMMLDQDEAWHTFAVDEQYLRRNAPLVAERLQQAGIRLGKLLNQSLQNGRNNE